MKRDPTRLKLSKGEPTCFVCSFREGLLRGVLRVKHIRQRNTFCFKYSPRALRDRVWCDSLLTGVLAGAVHSSHPGTLLTGGGLPQGQVDDVDQSKLLVVPQHVSIDVVIDAHALCRWRKRRRLRNLRDTCGWMYSNGTEEQWPRYLN